MAKEKTAVWSEIYATGIRAIDNDHKGLFEDIRFLGKALVSGAEAGQIDRAISSLEKYCAEHFGREETFMIGARYPGAAAHIREHRRMTGQIARLRALYAADPKQIDGHKVFQFLSNWLSEHILGVDMQYVPYLRGEKHGREAADTESARDVSITVPQGESKVVGDFVRIIESDHPVAKELAHAIEQFEKRLEAEEVAAAKDLFCRP